MKLPIDSVVDGCRVVVARENVGSKVASVGKNVNAETVVVSTEDSPPILLFSMSVLEEVIHSPGNVPNPKPSSGLSVIAVDNGVVDGVVGGVVIIV
jgi:hypothetical protein